MSLTDCSKRPPVIPSPFALRSRTALSEAKGLRMTLRSVFFSNLLRLEWIILRVSKQDVLPESGPKSSHNLACDLITAVEVPGRQ